MNVNIRKTKFRKNILRRNGCCGKAQMEWRRFGRRPPFPGKPQFPQSELSAAAGTEEIHSCRGIPIAGQNGQAEGRNGHLRECVLPDTPVIAGDLRKGDPLSAAERLDPVVPDAFRSRSAGVFLIEIRVENKFDTGTDGLLRAGQCQGLGKTLRRIRNPEICGKSRTRRRSHGIFRNEHMLRRIHGKTEVVIGKIAAVRFAENAGQMPFFREHRYAGDLLQPLPRVSSDICRRCPSTSVADPLRPLRQTSFDLCGRPLSTSAANLGRPLRQTSEHICRRGRSTPAASLGGGCLFPGFIPVFP